MRFEIAEGTGDLIGPYNAQHRNPSPALQAVDRARVETWRARDAAGYYLRNSLGTYFIWNPKIHYQSPGFE
jgi:hypothetical protein